MRLYIVENTINFEKNTYGKKEIQRRKFGNRSVCQCWLDAPPYSWLKQAFKASWKGLVLWTQGGFTLSES